MRGELIDRVRKILEEDRSFLIDEIARISEVKAGLQKELAYTERALNETLKHIEEDVINEED